MRLGTAAIRSSTDVSGRRRRVGTYSVRKSAVKSEIGMPITSPISAMTTVP